MPFVGDDPMDLDRERKLSLLYDGDLLDVLADTPVVPLNALLVLVEVHFIREEPEHYSGLVLQLRAQGPCFNLSRLLGVLCDEHEVRLEVGK